MDVNNMLAMEASIQKMDTLKKIDNFIGLLNFFMFRDAKVLLVLNAVLLQNYVIFRFRDAKWRMMFIVCNIFVE